MINELKKRVLVLDGATGTAIQKYNLTDEDFQGKKGCNEILNITRPDVIKEIHTKYIEAGADIIETNSFNCNRISLKDYEIEDMSYTLSKKELNWLEKQQIIFIKLLGRKYMLLVLLVLQAKSFFQWEMFPMKEKLTLIR